MEWKNLNRLNAYRKLQEDERRVDLTQVMSGDEGAARVRNYAVPMGGGLTYYYAAKQVDDGILKTLCEIAEEASLSEKYRELYNGAVINTGEKRRVLHQLTRGQLGDDVICEGVNKRAFYAEQQKRIAEFANKVHAGEIVNENGERFTTAVQIGIGGSDLGPRAMYLSLENWARKNGFFKNYRSFFSYGANRFTYTGCRRIKIKY